MELLDAPGRRWLYSGGGYSVLQLLVEELTGRPFADVMKTEILDALGMTASSFHWRRTAATACPHDAEGGRIPEFCFAEQAAAGLVTTAAELARFAAAALPGPHRSANLPVHCRAPDKPTPTPDSRLLSAKRPP